MHLHGFYHSSSLRVAVGAWHTEGRHASQRHSLCMPPPQPCLFNARPQIRRKVLDGGRPEVPPLAELPGPDNDTFAPFEDYCQLMRWAGVACLGLAAQLWIAGAAQKKEAPPANMCFCHPSQHNGQVRPGPPPPAGSAGRRTRAAGRHFQRLWHDWGPCCRALAGTALCVPAPALPRLCVPPFLSNVRIPCPSCVHLVTKLIA